MFIHFPQYFLCNINRIVCKIYKNLFLSDRGFEFPFVLDKPYKRTPSIIRMKNQFFPPWLLWIFYYSSFQVIRERNNHPSGFHSDDIFSPRFWVLLFDDKCRFYFKFYVAYISTLERFAWALSFHVSLTKKKGFFFSL